MVTIETVVALGVAYVVLGGIILALAASFRLLSDKVDSFFALLIPEPISRITSRKGAPWFRIRFRAGHCRGGRAPVFGIPLPPTHPGQMIAV